MTGGARAVIASRRQVPHRVRQTPFLEHTFVVVRTRAACPAEHTAGVADEEAPGPSHALAAGRKERMRTLMSKLKRIGYLIKATALACVLGVIEMVQTQRGRRVLGALTLVAAGRRAS